MWFRYFVLFKYGSCDVRSGAICWPSFVVWANQWLRFRRILHSQRTELWQNTRFARAELTILRSKSRFLPKMKWHRYGGPWLEPAFPKTEGTTERHADHTMNTCMLGCHDTCSFECYCVCTHTAPHQVFVGYRMFTHAHCSAVPPDGLVGGVPIQHKTASTPTRSAVPCLCEFSKNKIPDGYITLYGCCATSRRFDGWTRRNSSAHLDLDWKHGAVYILSQCVCVCCVFIWPSTREATAVFHFGRLSEC